MTQINKKTNRKNKTNLELKYPAGHFTINEMLSLNTDFIGITLRKRVVKDEESGAISMLGNFNGGKGRPKKVYAKNPISNETLLSAQAMGITFEGQFQSYNVVSIDATKVPAETDKNGIIAINSEVKAVNA